jgi:hypothetical protein
VNELKLHALTCPQCGAPGVVREGTRITACERCGAPLCLTETTYPRYEAVSNMSAAQAVTAARTWLDQQKQVGMFGRPELVFIPFHEISGRRVGVFERKVPERKRVHRRVYNPQYQTGDIESSWVYEEKEDTKVMVSDVQSLSPAARTPWDLRMFDARAARRSAVLRTFDLVEAQRRATVFAEERSPGAAAGERYADKGQAEMVAASRRTLFFPFWSIPVQTEAGGYEIVIEGVTGDVIAWRLPQPYPASGLTWAMLAVPGALGLGHGLHALFFGAAMISPVISLAAGALLTAIAVGRSNRPDWSLRSWPEQDTIPRLERRGS